jgi:transcriptional regulator with GAF, ATPase, and Fis domain
MFRDITERVLMEQEQARLESQNSYLQEEIRSEHNFGEIVGSSPALLQVLREVDQVATRLIPPRSSSAKPARARNSSPAPSMTRSGRKSAPLVKVNCGAISAGLSRANFSATSKAHLRRTGKS